jgi:hypothetical protein
MYIHTCTRAGGCRRGGTYRAPSFELPDFNHDGSRLRQLNDTTPLSPSPSPSPIRGNRDAHDGFWIRSQRR